MKKNVVRALLTVTSCIGVAATGLMAIRDTKKSEKLPEYDGEKDLKLYFKRKVCDYIPTIAVGGVTVGCIVTNHVLTAKEIKALMAVSATTASLLKDYKDAIFEEFGPEGEVRVVKNVANRRFKSINGLRDIDILTDDTDNDLFYFDFTDSVFKSSKSKVTAALYQFNQKFVEEGKVSIDYLLDLLNIEPNIIYSNTDWGYGANLLEDGVFWPGMDIVEATTEFGETLYCLYLSHEVGIWSEDKQTYIQLD